MVTGQAPPFTITSPVADATVFETTSGVPLPLEAIAAFEVFAEKIGMGDLSDIALDVVKFVTVGATIIVVYASWMPVVGRRVKCLEGIQVGEVQQLVTKRVTDCPKEPVATLLATLHNLEGQS